MSVELGLWSSAFALVVTVAVAAAAVAQRRSGVQRWRWWGALAFVLGWLTALGAVLSPLDTVGEDGLLTAHIAQHMILGDLAAPLLLIGLPPVVAASARRAYRSAVRRPGRLGRAAALALSPVGALVLWALVTYVWLLPPLHRQAIPDGAVHALDHLSFLAFGVLVWLAAFDFRHGPAVRDWEGLKRSLATCDLPWWGRHVYAMVSRLAMVPAVTILWLAPTASYYVTPTAPPGPWTQRQDQVNAASMMLGLEILLAAFAVVLALVWVSISEGRARDRERPG